MDTKQGDVCRTDTVGDGEELTVSVYIIGPTV